MCAGAPSDATDGVVVPTPYTSSPSTTKGHTHSTLPSPTLPEERSRPNVQPNSPSCPDTLPGALSKVPDVLSKASPCPDVFISYNRASTSPQFLDSLTDQLQAGGCSVWRDSTHIAGGREWHGAVAQALTKSKHFLCLLTEGYLQSRHCINELFLADTKKKNIFPVFLSDLDMDASPGVSLVLSSLQWIKPHLSGQDWTVVASQVAAQVLKGLPARGVQEAAKPLDSYTVGEVCKLVQGLELDSALFHANTVSGEDLLQLTEQDMREELNMRPLQIRKLKQHIHKMKQH